MMKSSKSLHSGAWVVLFSLGFNGVAVPALPRNSEDAERMIEALRSHPGEIRTFTQSAVEERRHQGWRIEARPGQALNLTHLTGRTREIYLTPPRAMGVNVAFRIVTSLVDSHARFSITAYDPSFTTVFSRRSISISSGAGVEQARVQLDQTIQSMVNDFETHDRAAARSPKTLLRTVMNLFLPSAQASSVSPHFALFANAMALGMGIGVLCLIVLPISYATSDGGSVGGGVVMFLGIGMILFFLAASSG